MKAKAKISSGKRVKPTIFCDVCQHTVYDLAKHQQTEEHKRNARREVGRGYNSTSPRLPGAPPVESIEAPFPGRVRFGKSRTD